MYNYFVKNERCFLKYEVHSFFLKVHNLVEKMTSNGILKPERSMVLDSPKIIGCLNKALDPTPKLKSGKTKVNQSFCFLET